MSSKTYGPFRINGKEGQFCTIFVRRGDQVTVTAPAGDRIHLGGLNGEVGPDGRREPARGDGFPARALNRHSLIFRIGNGRWRQGGSTSTALPPATAEVDGEVIIHINDDLLTDNSGGWNVSVTRTTWRDIIDLPRPGSSALFQSVDGNMQLIATGNRTGTVLSETTGNLWGYQRDRSFNWTSRGQITNLHNSSLSDLSRERAYLYPSWFQGTDGRFWGVCVQGTQVKCFVQGMGPVDIPGANDCVGAPAMIQSHYGNRGNFELAYPTSNGIKFRFADNNSRSCDWRAPLLWDPRAPIFGEPGTQSVRMLQSSNGNLEVIASGRTATRDMQLSHWERDDRATWDWTRKATLSGSEDIAPSSIPAFMQSSFGTYEVLAPSVNGGLLHWHSDSGLRNWQLDRAIDPGGPRVIAVHMIQSDFGAHQNNFEVVAETGESTSAFGPGIGYGSLLFYWCNNDTAMNSDDGTWSGPFPVVF
ncbi:MAG TPA: hypothetical protein VFY61_10195 [Pyrinomonadaceae bacterium]|nr:hypothetical protein [Pyrinomonadaceae bacterium]